MEELRRLVGLIQEYNTRTFPLINFQDESTLDTKLYNLIKENKVAADKDAAFELYGSEKLPSSYRMLKHRLKKKLLNHIHFLDLPENKFTATNLVKVKCASLLFEAESLKAVHELSMAEKLLDQAFQLAKENEVNDYVVMALEQKQWISHMLCDQKKFNKQSKLLKHYYEIELAEREATEIYQELMLVVKTEFGKRLGITDSFLKGINTLKKLWEKTNSSKVFYYYHFLLLQYEEFQGDYHEISRVLEETENLLNKKVIHKNWFNFRFNGFARVHALLQTRQYELGLKLAEKYLEYFDSGSLNWFAFMENYLLIALHSKSYELFYHQCLKVLDNKHISKLSVYQIERWEIFRRYYLLIVKYRLNVEAVATADQIVPTLSVLPKDKEGFNVAIVVIEIIEQLPNLSIEDHEPNIEMLRKYISKYLRGTKAERARLFLRFLILVLTESFNYKKIRLKGDKLLKKLSATPLPGNAFEEVEIIPYEHLWEIVLEIVVMRNKSLA